jgi:hypothetical protein
MSPKPLEQVSPGPATDAPRSKEVQTERERAAVEDEMVRQIVRSIPRPSLERYSDSTRRALVESTPHLLVRSALRPPPSPLVQPSSIAIDRDRAETSENSGAPRGFELRPQQASRSPRLEANRAELTEQARDETTSVQFRTTNTEITQAVRPNLDGQIESLMTRRFRHLQGHPSPPAEQVINVTIGRIEVRATAAPSPPARATNQKPPVMSLDEYLRRRASGGRGGGE